MREGLGCDEIQGQSRIPGKNPQQISASGLEITCPRNTKHRKETHRFGRVEFDNGKRCQDPTLHSSRNSTLPFICAWKIGSTKHASTKYQNQNHVVPSEKDVTSSCCVHL